jgi:hypothetical protein
MTTLLLQIFSIAFAINVASAFGDTDKLMILAGSESQHQRLSANYYSYFCGILILSFVGLAASYKESLPAFALAVSTE